MIDINTRKFILYEKYFDYAKCLTDEQFGRVLRDIGRYFRNEPLSTPDMSNEERILFEMMKFEIQANFEKYDDACKKRKAAMYKNKNKNKNNKKNINNNKNNNININNNSCCDFEEIERQELKNRLKQISDVFDNI